MRRQPPPATLDSAAEAPPGIERRTRSRWHASNDSDPAPRHRPTVSVVIPAHTMKRWPLVVKAVESARRQTVSPEEVVLCIDNNPELLARAREQWPTAGAGVRVMANRFSGHVDGWQVHAKAHGAARRFGAGSARNCAVETVASDIVAFLDDDAWAEPEWLENLLTVYERFPVAAVGGPPLPDYETGRPVWFPSSFDWVFGCAYEGLPESTAPLRHLIGANMSVRRDAFVALSGFQSVDFDDLDLCMRLAARFGTESLYYEPRAVVHHYVPAERVSWRYFYRRCYFVNREKVQTFRDMGSAANLAAELEFVWRALTRYCVTDLRRGVAGEPGAFRAVGATIAGIALAGLGNLRGRLDNGSSSGIAPPLGQESEPAGRLDRSDGSPSAAGGDV